VAQFGTALTTEVGVTVLWNTFFSAKFEAGKLVILFCPYYLSTNDISLSSMS